LIIRQSDPSTDAGILEFEEDRSIVHIGSVTMVPLFSQEAFLRKSGTDGFHLALEGKKAVGAVLIAAEHEESSHLALVYGIKVDESWRCHGLGLQLMQQAESFAERSGPDRIVLETRPDNTPALSLFRKCDFVTVRESPNSLRLQKIVGRSFSMFTIDWEKYRPVDLSYTVVPPGSDYRPFKIERGYLADNAYKHDVRTHSHVGTHVEAPAHFFDDGKDTTEFPLTHFMGRAILLDVEDVAATPRITPEYLEQAIGDLIQEGDIVICRNLDEEAKAEGRKPMLTPEAARWLRQYRIKMLGVDNYFRLGEDVQASRALHDILQSEGVCLIEWLDNLDALQRREFFMMALPYKVSQMDSSWVRAVAIEER